MNIEVCVNARAKFRTYDPAVVQEIGSEYILVHYPSTQSDARMEKSQICPSSFRRSANDVADFEQTLTGGAALDPGLKAIKYISVPAREKLASDHHERMRVIWDAVQSVGDGYGRGRAKPFMKLPPKLSNPQYYRVIERPLHLEAIRKKINSMKYADMDHFESDMTLVFDNARNYFEQDEPEYRDAEILQNVFWEALSAVERGETYALRETPGTFVKASKRSFSEAEIAGFTGSADGALRPMKPIPTHEEQIQQTLDELFDENNSEDYQWFMSIPAHPSTLLLNAAFPTPLTVPPADLGAGEEDKLITGSLPIQKNQLPSEGELRTWTRESQAEFWTQRRAYWNRFKLSELQRECRKLSLWPGGDAPNVKDRLLRYDFCRSQLQPCETRTEEEDREADISRTYFQVVKSPMDLPALREKLHGHEYATISDFEKDLAQLLKSAQSVNAHISSSHDIEVTFTSLGHYFHLLM